MSRRTTRRPDTPPRRRKTTPAAPREDADSIMAASLGRLEASLLAQGADPQPPSALPEAPAGVAATPLSTAAVLRRVEAAFNAMAGVLATDQLVLDPTLPERDAALDALARWCLRSQPDTPPR